MAVALYLPVTYWMHIKVNTWNQRSFEQFPTLRYGLSSRMAVPQLKRQVMFMRIVRLVLKLRWKLVTIGNNS